MKQKILLFVFVLLLVLPFVLIIQNRDKIQQYPPKQLKEDVSEEIEPEVIPEPPKPYEEILLSQMTTEEKVGQLFIFGIEGLTNLTPENKQFLIDTKVGGIILMSKNITSEAQLISLVQEIQSTNHIPLFISIDQEGGVVSRIKWDNTLLRSQLSITSPEEAYQIAKNKGDMLKRYGVNMNLAPVVEYSSYANSFIYKRVFSGDIGQVIQKSLSTISGYNDTGLISAIKHFPGHANTTIDPHYKLPSLNISNEQWNEHIESFSRIIKEKQIDALMVSHTLFPNIDSNPATISFEILNNRLKQGLNYNGLIISDDMEMNALDGLGSPTELAEAALRAGCDILIYSKYSLDNRYHQQVVYEHILNLVNQNLINIDEKVLKILQLKIKYGIIDRE